MGGSCENFREPLGGDVSSLIPALNGRVIAVSEAPSEAANAPQATNDFSMISHTQTVRVPCIDVKLDCVRVPCDDAAMAEGETTGSRFREIWLRSRLSQRQLAAAAGFSTASGLTRYVTATHDAPFPVDVAKRFAAAMAGKGEPPIQEAEIMALTGYPEAIRPNAVPIRFEGASEERMREDLPVYGTALGASRVIDGEAIEQATLNSGDVVRYVSRPVVLNGRADAYGLYVQGSSMYPVHPEGSLLLAEAKRPPRVGDDVVVYLRANGRDQERDDGERARFVMVKRLVRRTGQYIELEQFTPAATFRVDAADVLRVDRVLTLTDLLD